MNLELVPCMFKSRAGDGKESEVVGLIIRTPGSATGTLVSTSSTPPVTTAPSNAAKQPPKLKPKKSDPVIAPKRVESLPPKILPATSLVPTALPQPATTSSSSGSLPSANFGVGSFIELPLTSIGTPAKPVPRSRSKSTKVKKEKEPPPASSQTTAEPPASAPPVLPSTSFEMQSPPAILSEPSSYSQPTCSTTVPSAQSSYLPPISSMAPNSVSGPSTSYQASQRTVTSNGYTPDDLNVIEIAQSLRNEYWNNHQQQHPDPYYNHHDSSYIYPAPSQPPQPHPGPAYPGIYSQGTEYGGHDSQSNGYCQQNGAYVPPLPAVTTNGHHPNGWVPPRPHQQPYSGPLNQMTSSTPDSGIQSIDGSPPSTIAFTPPMVSPFTTQSNHFDPNVTQSTSMTVSSSQQHSSISQYSAGPIGSLHPSLSNEAPQQSHIQLPPLNYTRPPPQANDNGYLSNQRPSCSYPLNCDTVLDDMVPLHSPSPPALDDGDKPKDGDSDCDYSDMPRLLREDSEEAIMKKQPESLEARAASRTSQASEGSPSKEKKDPDAIAINPNMDANEIAKMLMSSLPSEKVQELLRSFRPAIQSAEVKEGEDEDTPPPALASSTTPPLEKEVSKKKQAVPRRDSGSSSKRRRSSAASSSATPITPNSSERPNTRSSTRNISPTRPVTPAANAKKGSNKSSRATSASNKLSPTKGVKNGAVAPAKLSRLRSPRKLSPKTSKKKSKVGRADKNNKAVRCVLKRHPLQRFHRPTSPVPHKRYKVVEAVRRTKANYPRLSTLDKLNMKLDDGLPAEFSQFLNEPSTLLTSRYDKASQELVEIFDDTHLQLPKVPLVPEASGSWRKRHAPESCQPEPAKKIIKIEKKKAENKGGKYAPLKITIRRPSSDDENGFGKKKKKLSIITPVSREEFLKIRSNVEIEPSPRLAKASTECGCTNEDPCSSTSGCINRGSFNECTGYSCHLFDTCQNRRLTDNRVVHQLQTFKHATKGNGLRSMVDIPKDALVCEFLGEVMRKDTYMKRLASGQTYPFYAVEFIPGGYVIDASKKGSLARFMNHSCQPNCVMQRWASNGVQRVGIFALDNIEAGAELTYDYSFHVYHKELIECFCEAPNCKGYISSMPPPIKPPTKPEELTASELELVKTRKPFLLRNLNKYQVERLVSMMPAVSELPEVSGRLAEIFNQFVHSCKLPRRWLHHLYRTIKVVFETAADSPVHLIDSFDATIKNCLGMYALMQGSRIAEEVQNHYLQIKRNSRISDLLEDFDRGCLLSFLAERPKKGKVADQSPRIMSATINLAYMDSDCPIGSYDPDKESLMFTEAESSKTTKETDSIRCICGIMDEGGEMYQCEQCHYWLHRDCLGLPKEPEVYICLFCERGLKMTPLVDILLKPQPEYRIDGCQYYKTLVSSRGIQVRVNECVYVERHITDEYKDTLKKFHDESVNIKDLKENKKAPPTVRKLKLPPTVEEPPESFYIKEDPPRTFHRKDVRNFRIERLFKKACNGERYAFGCYYARPHETYSEVGRKFYENEMFWTPLYDTLPLDVIVGRCLILEPNEYIAGRPKGPKFHEDDIYICEFSVDKNQNNFEKLSAKNHYPINTADYVFDRFKEPLKLTRDFTPFITVNESRKTTEKSHIKETHKAKPPMPKIMRDCEAKNLHRCLKNNRLLNP